MALCLIVLALVLAAGELKATSEKSIALSYVAARYGMTLESCRDEAHVTTDILPEWAQVWDHDFDANRREIGCAIVCDAIATTVTDLLGNCEKQNLQVTDDCSRTINTFVCFKAEAMKAGIAPYVALIKDVMNEI
ncbi:general odorant-binding protein 2-like [Cydia amplana]|uniref:general odorant-binding protein 2-like n=1 Tax=Cydia amplana TaxID=1869771 RepID=UPI002FE5484E